MTPDRVNVRGIIWAASIAAVLVLIYIGWQWIPATGDRR